MNTEQATQKTDNELIAEFMGIPKKDLSIDDHGNAWAANLHPKGITKHNIQLRYDTSWDWLMPVMEKIAKIPYDDEIMEQCDGFVLQRTDYAYMRTFGMLDEEGNFMVRINQMSLNEAKTLIEATYKAVVEFVRWYSQQPKP